MSFFHSMRLKKRVDMRDDFETLAAVISFITNSVSIASLIYILEKGGLKKIKAELETLIRSKMSDYYLLKQKYHSLIEYLKNPFLYISHLLILFVLICLVIILLRGPGVFFNPDTSSTLSKPLTQAEKIIYYIWLLGGLISYTLKGIIPTCELVLLRNQSKNWLAKNEPKIK